MKKQDTQREQRIIKRLFVRLFPLQAMASGLPAINGLINSIIIGRFLGTSATAAIGFAGPFTLLISSFAYMLSAGSQLLCGRSLGRGDKDNIRCVYSTLVVFSLGVGILFMLLSLFLSGDIANLLHSSKDSFLLTSDYIRGIGLGSAGSILIACFISFLQLDNAGNVTTVLVMIQLSVNVAGTLISVLFFDNGMLGVGLSTSLANIFVAVIAFIYLQNKSKLFCFSLKNTHFNTVKTIVSVGSPNAIQPICSMLRDIVINSVVFSLGGTLAVSAVAVCANVNMALSSFIEGGYSGASRAIAGVLVGERDSSSLRDLPKIMIKSAWYFYIGAFVLIFTVAKPLSCVFVSSPDDIYLYASCIRIYSLWLLTNIFQSPPTGIYHAMGKTRLVIISGLFNWLIVPAGFCLLFGTIVGFPAVCLFTAISEIACMLIMAVYFTVKAKRLPRSIAELCYIPSEISAPRERRFKAIISNEDEACKASRELIDFCVKNGLDSKKSYFCGLCLEEILIFTIQNRFNKKALTMDFRAICDSGKLKMILRDDCEEFNPLEWIKLCSSEDKAKSLGIKTIQKIALEMNYSYTLGLNVLMIMI